MNQTNYTLFLPFFPLQREKEEWVGEWAFSLVSCLSSGENTVKALSVWIIYVKCSNESLRLQKIMDFFCALPLKKHSANGMWCMKLLLSYPMQCYAYWFSPNTYTHARHFVKSSAKEEFIPQAQCDTLGLHFDCDKCLCKVFNEALF